MVKFLATSVADLRGREGRPRGPNFFNSMQFLGNFGKIVCWCPPLLGGLTLPPRGNPGSATVICPICSARIECAGSAGCRISPEGGCANVMFGKFIQDEYVRSGSRIS